VVADMFVVLIIEILLILGLIILTRSFLQTRRKAMLWTMVAVAGLIAIITIPVLMVIFDLGTNGW
jgi:beta-lactamase regulating signal transducer with metallopeptidase domain